MSDIEALALGIFNHAKHFAHAVTGREDLSDLITSDEALQREGALLLQEVKNVLANLQIEERYRTQSNHALALALILYQQPTRSLVIFKKTTDMVNKHHFHITTSPTNDGGFIHKLVLSEPISPTRITG